MRIEAAPAVIDTDFLGSNLITPIGSSPDPHGQCRRAEPADAGGSVDVLAGQPASVLALETTLLVHRDCFKEREFHAAQRALARLRQAGQPADAMVDRQLILDRHAAIVQDLDPRPDGEAGALRKLLSFPVPAPDVAQRIHARSASLADAVAALALRDDLAAERGRLRGAVQAVARIINRRTGATLDAIPARLKDMEDCFERLTHADFGIVASSYDSLKSHVRRVVGLVDNSGKRRLATTLLSPAWRDLAERVKTAAKRARNTSARGGIKGDYAKLYPLIGFCHDHGIAPSAVADATLGDLQAALTLDGCADPFDKARSVVYGWERLQQTVPGFPTQTLARLYRAQDGRQSHVKLESMPPEFQADWRAFTARFGEAPDDAASTLSDCVVEDETPPDVDGLDEDLLGDTWGEDPADLPALDEAPDLDAHLSPAYLTCIKSHVVNAAAIALASGRQVSGLGDIVKAPVVERLVRAKLKRQLDKDRDHPRKNATLKNTVTGLLTVARLIGAPKATLDQLEALRDKVDPHLKKRIKGEDGKITRKYSNHRMGPRHKERIEAMANDVALFNWFRMIPVLFERHRLIERFAAGHRHAIGVGCPLSKTFEHRMHGRPPAIGRPRIERYAAGTADRAPLKPDAYPAARTQRMHWEVQAGNRYFRHAPIPPQESLRWSRPAQLWSGEMPARPPHPDRTTLSRAD